MPGKRTFALLLILAALMAGGNYLVPRGFRSFQQWKRNQQLIEALRIGHLSLVEKHIAAGANVNIHVSPTRSVEMFNAECPQSPLHLAAKQLNVDAIGRLIERGAQVDWRDKYGETPLMTAVSHPDDEWVFGAGLSTPSPNPVFGTGPTIQSLAATGNKTGTVQALVSAGANVNAEDDFGKTVLMKATEEGHRETVQILLKAGAKVNARDHDGQTPLIYAANQTGLTEIGGKRQFTPPEIVQLLLNAGADPRLTDKDDETALIKSEECGEIKTMAALRKSGGKGLRDTLKGVPEAELFYAVRTRNIPAVKRLLQRGARLAVRDKQGHSPLVYAAVDYFGENDLLACVLQNSSDLQEALEMRDPHGLSVLLPHVSDDFHDAKLGDAIDNPNLGNKVRDLLCFQADSDRRQVLKNAGINADQKLAVRY